MRKIFSNFPKVMVRAFHLENFCGFVYVERYRLDIWLCMRRRYPQIKRYKTIGSKITQGLFDIGD